MIEYNPVTGKFYKLYKNHSKETANNVNSAGYRTVWYGGKCMQAHRLAFKLMGETIPEGYVVDHINRDKADNRWCNLRAVPKQVNNYNRSQTKDRKLPTGVRVTTSGSYQARVRLDGKLISLGSFKELSDAVKAYMEFKTPLAEG